MKQRNDRPRKGLGVLLGILFLLSLLPISAYAAPVLNEGPQTGAITIYKFAGTDTSKPLSGVTFSAYQILTIEMEDGQPKYTIPDDFYPFFEEWKDGAALDSPERIDSSEIVAEMSALKKYIRKNSLKAYQVAAKTDRDGYTRFSELPLGVYLLLETGAPSSVTVRSANFFVSIPMTNAAGTDWVYEVTAYPKNQVTTPPGPGTDPDPDPDNPTHIPDGDIPGGGIIIIPDEMPPLGDFFLPISGGGLPAEALLWGGPLLMLLSVIFVIWMERKRRKAIPCTVCKT